MQIIRGVIESIVFRNDENGYTVLALEAEAGYEGQETFFDNELVAVGHLPHVNAGERVELSGDWSTHRDYGEQFKFTQYMVLPPEEADAIEKYLGGGSIKGVRAATARNIVSVFGKNALWIIENQPHRLAEIRGISPARAEQIAASYHEQMGLRTTIMSLQQLGLSVSQSTELCKVYGADTLALLRENPYRLVQELPGIGFRIADGIAQNMGMGAACEQRIAAGLQYSLQWARNEGGHTCLPRDTLLDLASRALCVDFDLVAENLDDLLLKNTLLTTSIDDTDMIFLPQLYQYEAGIAHQLLLLLTHATPIPGFDIAQELSALERETGLLLDAAQRDAIITAFSRGVLVITGGPGTGKTTIINFILRLMHKMGLECVLCAPTGRAAKRLGEATHSDASTIHRLLEYTGEYFLRDDDNPLECDVLIVDEMSMVDVYLMHSLLRATKAGTRLILAGDVDQLPSVGAGNVLRDMIDSQTLPVTRLTQVFRQASLSRIVTNAHRINRGEMPLLDFYEDFAFESIASQEATLERLVGICERKRLGDVYKDLQLLSPTKKGSLGVKNINIRLQQALNPPQKRKNELAQGNHVFREGDKVMQIKNDYNIEWTRPHLQGIESGVGVFNGDMGVIAEIDHDHHTVELLFDDDRTAFYEFKQMANVNLAYCISIHKSQGSEFPIVLMPMFHGPPMLMTRNLLYTAVTRAKRCVVMLGRESAISQMVQNTQERRRHSSLRQCLANVAALFTENPLPPSSKQPDGDDPGDAFTL